MSTYNIYTEMSTYLYIVRKGRAIKSTYLSLPTGICNSATT